VLFSLSFKLLVLRSPHRFVALSTRLAVLGIAIAVAAMITVVSIMSGFKQEMDAKIASQGQQVVLTDLWDQDLELFSHTLLQLPYVNTAQPFTQGYGLVRQYKSFYPLLISAVPNQQDAGIMVERGMSYIVDQGEELTMILPTQSKLPKQVKQQVAGFFTSSVSLPKGLMHVQMRQDDFNQLGVPHHGRGLVVELHSAEDAYSLREFLGYASPQLFVIKDWIERFEPLLDALSLQQHAMIITLFLIVVVSLFSLVSGLLMMVAQKSKQITMLKLMGMSNRAVTALVVLQGIMICVLGTLLGYMGGYLLSNNSSTIVAWLEQQLGFVLFHTKVYGVQSLPIKLSHSTNLILCMITVVLGFIASLIPAIGLRKLNPVEVLRHG
jgi:lipoprotein-releasing system permease protein